jgi:hypothetical protein
MVVALRFTPVDHHLSYQFDVYPLDFLVQLTFYANFRNSESRNPETENPYVSCSYNPGQSQYDNNQNPNHKSSRSPK